MLKGKTVQHAVYGAGTIIEVKDDAAYVHFQGARSRGATRKFLVAALFNDDLFPRQLNAAIWATRGMDAAKRSQELMRQTESETMQKALDLGHQPTKPRRPQ